MTPKCSHEKYQYMISNQDTKYLFNKLFFHTPRLLKRKCKNMEYSIAINKELYNDIIVKRTCLSSFLRKVKIFEWCMSMSKSSCLTLYHLLKLQDVPWSNDLTQAASSQKCLTIIKFNHKTDWKLKTIYCLSTICLKWYL